MTTRESHPVRTVVRHMAGVHRPIFAWFWSILVTVWAAGLIIMSAFADFTTSVWRMVGQSAPTWFLMIITLFAASVSMPRYVAHGICGPARPSWRGPVRAG